MSNFLGVELRMVNQDLIDLLDSPKQLEPCARVDLYDVDTATTTEITDIRQFSITRSLVSGDSFNLVIGDASTWHSRTVAHANELAARKNYWFKFHMGYTIDGEETLIPYFVGVAHQVPEDYGPTSEAITINGYGLTHLLRLISGSLSNQSEDISTIIQTLIDSTSIEYNFISLPAKSLSNQDIDAAEGLKALDYLLSAFTVTTERFVTGDGVVVTQVKQEGEDSEYIYAGDDILTLNRTFDTSKLITECTVQGATDTATVTDASGYYTNYGRLPKTVSNELIDNNTDATNAATETINDSIKRAQQCRFKIPFNPYLNPGAIVNLDEDERSLSNEDIYIETITATYTPGRESASTISGYILS